MKEKVVQRILEIPDYLVGMIDKEKSINKFINEAIIKNFNSDISLVRISKKTFTIPVRVRINVSVYNRLKELVSIYNISMQKLIIHFILSELFYDNL